MVSYLNELLDRVVAIELEAMALQTPPVTKVDARPYMYPPQDSFPYFRNRIASNTITEFTETSAEFDASNPLVVIRFIVAHVTEGYRGEPERKLYEWLPMIKTVFQQRQWLTSAAYPERMDNLLNAQVIDGGGMRMFVDSGLNNTITQVGAEIQLQCVFPDYIDQEDF